MQMRPRATVGAGIELSTVEESGTGPTRRDNWQPRASQGSRVDLIAILVT